VKPLSHREREGPAAKRWEGERFHRQPENLGSFRCALFEESKLSHGCDRQLTDPSGPIDDLLAVLRSARL
jgi:hypothetical protein